MELQQEDFDGIMGRIDYMLKSPHNIELEAIFNPVSLTKSMDRRTFELFVSRLKGLGFNEEMQPEQLDIRCDKYRDIRISIKGIEDISKYCKSNQLDDDMNIDYIKKGQVEDYDYKKGCDIKEYNIRVNIKEENLLDQEEDYEEIESVKNDLKIQKKSFRLKKRISYYTPDDLFRFDLTVLKVPEKMGDGQYKKSTSLLNSNILNSSETFEVELEYIGEDTDEEFTETEIMEKFVYYIGIGLQTIQKTDFIITKQHKRQILDEYQQLIKQDKLNWIGPQPVSLDMVSIRKYDDETIPTITRDYSVTEKADGERYMMFVNGNGNAYLINNRWNVIDLGLKSSYLNNSILDGEYVLKDKNGLHKPQYLAYDLYFLKGKDVREYVLHTENGKNGRIDFLERSLKKANWENMKEQNYINIRAKQFYYGNTKMCDDSIFTHCKKILQWSQTDACDYETDGLIFTPINKKVGEDMIKKYNLNYTGKTWGLCKKWKPPVDNTIDFMIDIVKKPNEQGVEEEVIEYDYTPGSSVPEKYKTLTLMCGISKNQIKRNNCKDILEGNINYNTNETNEYFATVFKPDKPEDPSASVCKVYLSEDDRMLTKKGEEILDGMIVEMSYNLDIRQWIPRNIRYDKTEKKNSGLKEYGNNFNTANSIWDTIHNPITEHMIQTGKDIPEEQADEVRYYVGGVVPRSNSMTKSMLDFHNTHIKRQMITGVCKNMSDSVFMDLCCGRGGDINKWSDVNISSKKDVLPISLVVGMDNVKNNIESKNGACDRYVDKKRRYKNKVPDAVFVWGDASKEWNKAGMDSQNNDILNILWGGINEADIPDNMKRLYGSCLNGFDVINCQFAIHYLFGDKTNFDILLNNISTHINYNGYFIGTCFDGATIYNEFKDKKLGDYIVWENNGNPVWRIQKNYENIGETLPMDDTCLGKEINVFAETINQTLSENLVNFDYFEQKMNENGLYIVSDDEANQIGFPKGSALLSEVYNYLDSSDRDKLNMSEKEKQFSFYNRYFIFVKKPVLKKKKKKLKMKIQD